MRERAGAIAAHSKNDLRGAPTNGFPALVTFPLVAPNLPKSLKICNAKQSFKRHFYKPQPLRTLEEISTDILAIEQEAEGLLDGLLKMETTR